MRLQQYLQTVHDVFGELQQVLAAYTKLAVTLDEDYKKYSPASPYFNFDASKVVLQIDDVASSEELETDGDDLNGKHDGNTSETKRKSWSLFGFSLGSSKTRKPALKALISVKNLPQGVQWLFTREKLEETLRKFKEWNDDLQHLIAPLLYGFGFYENKKLQERLQPDGKTNIFQGHIELNNLTDDRKSGLKDIGSSKGNR